MGRVLPGEAPGHPPICHFLYCSYLLCIKIWKRGRGSGIKRVHAGAGPSRGLFFINRFPLVLFSEEEMFLLYFPLDCAKAKRATASLSYLIGWRQGHAHVWKWKPSHGQNDIHCEIQNWITRLSHNGRSYLQTENSLNPQKKQ